MTVEALTENEGLGSINPDRLGSILTAAEQGNPYGLGAQIVDFSEAQLSELDIAFSAAERDGNSPNVMHGPRLKTMRRIGMMAIEAFNDMVAVGRGARNASDPGQIADKYMHTLTRTARVGAPGVARAIRPRKPIDQDAVLNGFLSADAGRDLANLGVRSNDLFESLLYRTFEDGLDLIPREARVLNGILGGTSGQNSAAEQAEARWNVSEIVAAARHISPVHYLVRLNLEAAQRQS